MKLVPGHSNRLNVSYFKLRKQIPEEFGGGGRRYTKKIIR